MAETKWLAGGTSSNGVSTNLYISYSTSTNNAANQSTITCGMYIVVSGGTIGSWTDWGGSYCGGSWLTFNGTVPSNTSGTYWLCSGHTFTVNHNSDGSGSAEIQWKWGVRSSWGNVWEPSGSFWIGLPKIPKQANLTSAPDFTDEENPTIKYSNPAGNSATSLQACISFTGATPNIPYRDVSKTGSSYTFTLSDAEREILRNGCLTSNSRTVYFYLKTVIGGQTYYSKLLKTLTIVNAEPTWNPTVVDVDESAVAITGDASKLIKFFSDAKCLFNYQLKKGATIADISIKHNGATKYDNESYWYNVENNIFEFSLTDSRGNKLYKKYQAPLFDYVKLTCNVEGAISTMGNGYFSIKGNYYNGAFGGTENYLLVQYQYKKAGEEYSELQYATASVSGNTYSASISIKGLDYRAAYHIRAVAIDSAMTVWSAELVARATPIFDWGENDFNFNVPITIQGRGYGENKILWEGALPMGSNQAINLYGGKISEQPHGIVLIFTGFDEPNPLNQSVCSHFVSKEQVALFGSSVGHTFILGYNATLAKFGAKYLYFSDDSITGHSGNTTYGTATPGFEIDNPYWCLRYVIGV